MVSLLVLLALAAPALAAPVGKRAEPILVDGVVNVPVHNGIHGDILPDALVPAKRAEPVLEDGVVEVPVQNGIHGGIQPAGEPINDLNIKVNPAPPAQCGKVTVSFDGGVAPYTLKIGTGGWYVDNSAWLHEFPAVEGQVEWVVDANVGDALNFQIWDAEGKTKNQQNVLVQQGDDGCLKA